MSRVEVLSRVGSDGVLRLNVSLPEVDAGREVKVTVESARPSMTQEQWREAVLRTAGKWQGDFERPPQGEYEEREPLP
jgi:hypothetical protein